MTLYEEVASLLVFFLVIAAVLVLVFKPVKVPIWKTQKSWVLSYAYAPMVGVVVLLIIQVLGWKGVGRGIVGDQDIKPYGIVILFMSLAYVSSSLDSTGVFVWLALHITSLSKGNTGLLFCFYFMLTSLMTTFTSNDIAIMTLTPIIFYFGKATNINPIPFLAAEYVAANIWGMMLFTGNPTNIIVADAFNMTFLGYSKWMALPTIAAGLGALGVLYVQFKSQLPPKVCLPSIEPSLMLTDKLGAVLGTLNLLACLGLLAAAPTLKWELWLVTLVSAGVQMIYNLYSCMRNREAKSQDTSSQLGKDPDQMNIPAEGVCPEAPQQTPLGHPPTTIHGVTVQVQAGAQQDHATRGGTGELSPAAEDPNAQGSAGEGGRALEIIVPSEPSLAPSRGSFLSGILHLPWEIVPFVLGMFILVEALVQSGWVDRFASWLASAMPALPLALFVPGLVSTVLANTINNQPMTILMTRVCMSEQLKEQVSEEKIRAALFSVVAASNLGANFTVIGALAGVMWKDILSKRGIRVGYGRFARLVVPSGLVTSALALLVLGIQFSV